MSFVTTEGSLQYYLNQPLNYYFNLNNQVKTQNNNTVQQIPGLVMDNTIYNKTAINGSKYINKDYFERITGFNYYKNFNVSNPEVPVINAEKQYEIELNYYNTLQKKKNELLNMIKNETNSQIISNLRIQIYKIDEAINKYNWVYLNIKPKLLRQNKQEIPLNNGYLTTNQINYISKKYNVSTQEIIKNLPTYKLLLDYDLDTTEILNLTNLSNQTPEQLFSQNIFVNIYDLIKALWNYYCSNVEFRNYIEQNWTDPSTNNLQTFLDQNYSDFIISNPEIDPISSEECKNIMELYLQLYQIGPFKKYYNDTTTIVGRSINVLKNKQYLTPYEVFSNFTYYNLSNFILPNIQFYRREMLKPYFNYFVFSDKLYSKYSNVNRRYIDKFKPIFQALYILNVPPERINLYL